MPTHHTRISIIGCGHVGTSCAFAILQTRLVREIVLIGDTETHVQGEAMDLQQAVPLGSPIRIFAGTYKDAAESSIVIVTVGTPGKFQGSRLDMLAGNVVIVRSCIAKLMAEGFNGVVIIATNPVDVLTYIVQKETGLSPGQVIGSGTLLDTERLRHILGEQLNVDPRSVHAAVIGEHGDSSVAVWSAAQVAGLPLAHYPGANALPSHEELLIAVRYAGPVVAGPQRQHLLRHRLLCHAHLRSHPPRRALRSDCLNTHDRPVQSPRRRPQYPLHRRLPRSRVRN